MHAHWCWVSVLWLGSARLPALHTPLARLGSARLTSPRCESAGAGLVMREAGPGGEPAHCQPPLLGGGGCAVPGGRLRALAASVGGGEGGEQLPAQLSAQRSAAQPSASPAVERGSSAAQDVLCARSAVPCSQCVSWPCVCSAQCVRALPSRAVLLPVYQCARVRCECDLT